MKYSNKSILSNHRFNKHRSTAWYSTIAAICFYSSMGYGQTDNQNFLVGIALDKTITIQANNASLKDVLLEIEAKTGIQVNFVADIDQRVSVNIEDQTIENAIGKLTPNYMIMRDQLNGKSIISEIIIISDDPTNTVTGDGSSFLPSGQPAPQIIEEVGNEPNAQVTDDPSLNQPALELPAKPPTPAPNN